MKTLEITEAQMRERTARFADYANSGKGQPATRALWGGLLVPLMAKSDVPGRCAGAILPAPSRACTSYLELVAGAGSLPYRNPDAFENILCLEGRLELSFGNQLEHTLQLERFDMVSFPSGVQHALRNPGTQPARMLLILNGASDCSYPAVFTRQPASAVPAQDLARLNARIDTAPEAVGRSVSMDEIAARVTRFKTLVPYKRALNATSAIPAEATEWLTASSVYPLIIPEGHIGRSQNAPLKGMPGLYSSIAECVPDDGPLPHAHFDTQESFFVLDGEWDITWGYNDEFKIEAKPFDLVAMPTGAMRSFRNSGKETARLFVIIQGEEKMSDLVVYTPAVGEEIRKRYGEEVVQAFNKVNIAFDAEKA